MKKDSLNSEALTEAARFLYAHLDVLRNLQTASAERAEKFLLLTNGGAVVATLSFIGASATAKQEATVWFSLSCFVAGVVLCGILAAINYHGSTRSLMTWLGDTDRFYANEIDLKDIPSNLNATLKTWRWAPVVVGYLAFFTFVVGSAAAIRTVSATAKNTPSSVAAPSRYASESATPHGPNTQTTAPVPPAAGESPTNLLRQEPPGSSAVRTAPAPVVLQVLPAEGLTTSDRAAWVQAIGSILAIIGSVGVAIYQLRKQRNDALALEQKRHDAAELDAAKTMAELSKRSWQSAGFLRAQIVDRTIVHEIAEGNRSFDIGALQYLETVVSAIPLHTLPHQLVIYPMLVSGCLRQMRDKIEQVLRVHRTMDANAFSDFFKSLDEMVESLKKTKDDVDNSVQAMKR